jgi:hypothetical protein
MILAIIKKLLLKNGVGKVSAVPCQKIVHPVQNGQPKMRCIRVGFWRQAEQTDDFLLKFCKPLRNVQNRDAGQVWHPPGGSTGIASTGLIRGEDRHVEAKTRPLVIPLVMRGQLIHSDLRLAAGVCGQVARNRGLNVNRLHSNRLLSLLAW